jgi:hypothetical protein
MGGRLVLVGPTVSPVPIVPDTKDWTWVLERSCPECGFDARIFPREQIGDMLRGNAAVWGQVLQGADGVHTRPSEDVWSPLEYGCHVRDVYRLYDRRLESMLTQDDPLFPNWDQDATAVESRYGEQDPQVVAKELIAAGATLAERFDGVVDEQWQRTGRRSDGAVFTVESFARYFIHDPVHHLYDVGW